jgi:uncharacterized LabA/DUF88 family protein
MPQEPAIKRAVAFFDGQNLFYAAKSAFGYAYPNYDPSKLAALVCRQRGWELESIRFYTGVPNAEDKPYWHMFWKRKLLALSRSGVHVYSRPLRYRDKVDPRGVVKSVGEEKGVDVRIAIDVLSCVWRRGCDVALIFSQDQDLSELADEIRVIASERDCWLKVASAFPYGSAYANRRGIDHTDWIRIARPHYDACLDPWDYVNREHRQR